MAHLASWAAGPPGLALITRPTPGFTAQSSGASVTFWAQDVLADATRNTCYIQVHISHTHILCFTRISAHGSTRDLPDTLDAIVIRRMRHYISLLPLPRSSSRVG